MSLKRLTIVVGCLLFVSAGKSLAQFPEDALRLSMAGTRVGARPLAMGSAYTALANDFSAIFWNPAGLAQVRQFELSGGISYLGFKNNTTFFGKSSNFTNSSTNLSTAGFVYPIPTRRGSLTLAFGYNRSADFTTALAFDAFNPNSSIIPSLYDPDEDRDLAWLLYLEDTTGYSPIQRNVNQRGEVLESNGVNNWSVAGAVEVGPRLYIGATATFINGSYAYNRNFVEEDSRGIYTTRPFDFQTLILDNTISWDLSGYGLKVGLLYAIENSASFGFTIKAPSRFTVKEKFRSDGTSVFKTPDRNGNFRYTASVSGSSEYDVQTPFVFGAGAAIKAGDLVLSGDAELTDWSQMEFKNPSPNISDLTKQNSDIKRLFRSTANLRAGLEFLVPNTDVRLRGGFTYNPSPFDGDPSSFAQKYITGGVGFALQNAVYVDIAYAHGYWDTYHVNYDRTSRTDESVTTNNILFTISYRF